MNEIWCLYISLKLRCQAASSHMAFPHASSNIAQSQARCKPQHKDYWSVMLLDHPCRHSLAPKFSFCCLYRPNQHEGPRTLHTKLQKMQLSSIQKTNFLSTAAKVFFNSLFYGQQFFRKIFAVLCVVCPGLNSLGKQTEI